MFTRTVSPSLHPRSASGGATDFLQASALSIHQQALRPPGGEDARCVQPTSATQTICVHPHLSRSRLATATFAAGRPHGVLGSAWYFRGPGRFTTSSVASADRFQPSRELESTALRPSDTSVGVFFPRRCCDRASDTPVATLRSPSASLVFTGAASSPFARSRSLGAESVRTGRKVRLAAETTVAAAP
jgi:hypothetical protein